MPFAVKFQNGKTVTFNQKPTPQDINEVAQKLGITGGGPAPQAGNVPSSQGEPSDFSLFGAQPPSSLMGGNTDSTRASVQDTGLQPLADVGNAITHSEQAAGQDISSAAEEAIPSVKKAQGAAEQSNLQLGQVFGRLLKERHDLAAQGKPTDQLDSILADDARTLGITNLQKILPPGAQKTQLQVAADFAGVALDVISAGQYGEGAAETGSLLTKADKAAYAAEDATVASAATDAGGSLSKGTATVGQNLAKVGVKTAKTFAEGAGIGYGYDVTNAAQQGKTGAGMFKPGLGTAIGAGIPLLAGGLTAAGQASKGLGHVFSGSYLPDVADEFAAQGIKPPVGAVTNSGAVQGAEALASKGMFGKEIIQSYADAAATLDAKTDSVVASIKPMTNLSDENLGKTIQQGLQEYDDNFRITEDKVYAEFGDKYGASPTVAATTKDTLQTIIEEQGSDYYKGIDPSMKRMLDRMTGLSSPEAKQLLSQGYSADMIMEQGLVKQPDLTFNELKATRTSIGEQLSRDPDNTALKRLYGSLSQDMQTAVSKTSPDGASALAKLNADYAAGKDKIESAIAKSIKSSNPESIAQNLFKRNSADTINQVKEIVGPDRFKDIQNAFLSDALESSVTRGKFDVSKFQKYLQGYDQETLDAMLTENQQANLNQAITDLNKIKKLQGALTVGSKMATGSQTAFLARIGIGSTLAGNAILQMFQGNFAAAAAMLAEPASDLATEYGGAKMFTSDFGRKILTTGMGNSETTGALANAAMKAVPSAAKTGISMFGNPNSGNQ